MIIDIVSFKPIILLFVSYCLNEVVLCIRSTLCHEAASKARSLHTDPQIHVPFGAELFLPPSRLHLPSLFKSVSLLLPSSYWNWPMFFLFASSQTWSGVLWYLGFVSILSILYPMGAQEISSICHYLLLLLYCSELGKEAESQFWSEKHLFYRKPATVFQCRSF